MAYRLAPQAEADLEDVAFYLFVQTGSLEIADRLIQSVTERFDLLAAHPRAGRAREDLQRGVRGFPVGEYVVLYRIEGDEVVVLRVVHGSRDLEALLRE